MSSITGNHDNHKGKMVSNGTPESRNLQILVTADIAFSVALMLNESSLAVGDWMAVVSRERASKHRGGQFAPLRYIVTIYPLAVHLWRSFSA